MDVDVTVRKGDHVVTSIKRPLRDLNGSPAVTYRGRLWPVRNGSIDIRPDPLPQLAGETAAVEASDGAPSIDADQLRVIEAPVEARILVPAGPGSGKTEVTARRIAHLLALGLQPSRLLVLSFSRSAVRTLTRRLSALSGTEQLENLRHVSIRTFDSWAFRLLRLAGEQPRTLLSRTHEANIEAAADLLGDERQHEARELLGLRQHVFVDEFQDLTGSRARLVRELLALLAPPGQVSTGFTLLGDPAQAIYGFTSRDHQTESGMDLWQQIRLDYAGTIETIPLRRNHRSAEGIASFALGLRAVLESGIAPEAKLSKVRKAIHGLPASEDDLGPQWITRPFRTSAILARSNGEALRVVQKLFGRDTTLAGGRLVLRAGSWSPPPPAWIGALLSPLKAPVLVKSKFEQICAIVSGRLVHDQREALGLPSCEDAWQRLLQASGKAGEEQSLVIADLRERLEWPDAFPDDQEQPDEGLLVTTVHQSKGMEFDEVHLLEPREAKADDAPLEEASVGFVGVTRAGSKLGRIRADAIYPPLTKKSFSRGPDRLSSWRSGWINLEVGLAGDIVPESFVDVGVHGSAEAVKAVQELLLERVADLRGHKVLLQKVAGANKGSVFYDIHLQDDDEAGLRLGRTSGQLTRALLEILWKRGYSLPSRIMNLRIAAIGTMTSGHEVAADIPEPWRSSQLWLGCSLFGTGDFRTFKRRARK